MNARKLWQRRLRRVIGDASGQDMIEYALLVAALAVIVGACVPTQVIPVLNTVYSKISSSLNAS